MMWMKRTGMVILILNLKVITIKKERRARQEEGRGKIRELRMMMGRMSKVELTRETCPICAAFVGQIVDSYLNISQYF